MKNENCKHEKTHIEYVTGSHKKYEIHVCNRCGKVIKSKEI